MREELSTETVALVTITHDHPVLASMWHIHKLYPLRETFKSQLDQMSALWNCKFCEGDIKLDGIKVCTIRFRYLEVCYWGPTGKRKHSNKNLHVCTVHQ